MARCTVGVVVTAHNYGQYLEACLRSLDGQTAPPDEVIVVDDASDDDTPDVLARVIPTLSIGRVRVLRSHERRGLAASMNHGFSECQTEFVAHVDADDVCLPRYLEALSQALADSPRSSYAYPRVRLTGAESGIYDTHAFDGARLYWMGNYIPNVAMVRRAHWAGTDGYRDLPTHLDWDFWLTLLERHCDGILVDEVLYEWRRHAAAMTYQPAITRLRTRLAIQWHHRSLAVRYAGEGGVWTWRAISRRVVRHAHTPTLTASGWVVPDADGGPGNGGAAGDVGAVPRVTALMASHNRRDHTVRAVGAFLLSATRCGCDAHVVLVDDGSTDGTEEAVRAVGGDRLTVLRGPGSWYWARSMAEAERLAGLDGTDFVLWLNDDVILADDALGRLISTAREYAGAVSGPVVSAGGAVTYGGYDVARGFGRLRFDPVRAVSPVPRPLDAANGNCLLVPQRIARQVGAIDGQFEHAYADLDYSLRIRAAGVPLVQGAGTFGTCDANPTTGRHLDPDVPVRERLRLSQQPKAIPVRSHVRFLRRHAGPSWWLVLIQAYAHVLWPRLVSEESAERTDRAAAP